MGVLVESQKVPQASQMEDLVNVVHHLLLSIQVLHPNHKLSQKPRAFFDILVTDRLSKGEIPLPEEGSNVVNNLLSRIPLRHGML